MCYNIKGLGKRVERKVIQELTFKYTLDMVRIHEIKMKTVKKSLCKSVWYDKNFDWSFKASDGNSRGVLKIWNDAIFCKLSGWYQDDLLAVKGIWCNSSNQCLIINIYSSCVLVDKLQLWNSITLLVEQSSELSICVLGDFNSIVASNGRMGTGEHIDHREIVAFDDFIFK